MQNIAVISGKNRVSLDDLKSIELPEKTDSYQPLAHDYLARIVADRAAQILPDRWELARQEYVIARGGQQMFGVFHFRGGSSRDLGLAVAIRNSYDKSIAAAIGAGPKVFVCDNLMINADFLLMRKHTSKMLDAATRGNMVDVINQALGDATVNFNRGRAEARQLIGVPLNDSQAGAIAGRAFFDGLITTPQLSIIRKQWQNPTHEDFAPRNLWSLYNDFTEVLKTAAPITAVQQYRGVHQRIIEEARSLRDGDFIP